MTGVKRINFKTETKKKITKPKTEKENNNDLKNIIDKDNNSNNNSTKEKVKTASKKSKKATKEVTKEEVTKQTTSSKKKKEVPTTKIKKEKTNTKKETTSTTKKTEKKKQTPTKKTKVNSNKNTKTKEQQQTINKTIKDLEVKNTREKNLSKNYIIEYFNENDFRKKERGIKKFNMLAYKKLMFEYYPSLREGNFSGVVVLKNDQEQIFKYELKLPTDSTFSKVYEDIVLHYTVYENQKIVMLNNITPEDILIEGHQKELTTYKGVPISKSHAEKDMFKINLLNMIEK